jgi:SAM-dependent methyltransferase
MKVHWCCGDIYLKDYINIDAYGEYADTISYTLLDGNETTLDKYFKYPFIEDTLQRRLNRRPVIVDRIANILGPWTFEDDSLDEIVMISCFEHFWPKDALRILEEAKRTLKKNGRLIIDFPDIKKQVDMYYDTNPEYCMELIYCNHKNEFSIHHWGYTKESFARLFDKEKFAIEYRTIVEHSYPMIGAVVTKL